MPLVFVCSFSFTKSHIKVALSATVWLIPSTCRHSLSVTSSHLCPAPSSLCCLESLGGSTTSGPTCPTARCPALAMTPSARWQIQQDDLHLTSAGRAEDEQPMSAERSSDPRSPVNQRGRVDLSLILQKRNGFFSSTGSCCSDRSFVSLSK